MAVGASFADLAVILIDAKQGVLIQTKRHARICSLMGIKYFVFAVNKMDLVGYSKERFEEISAQIAELKEELSLENTVIIPVSATEGDNVTKRSANIDWYTGPVLLEYLENVDIKENDTEKGFYLPVQRVCRPNHTFRGFQGQIESGQIHKGDEITILPSNEKAHVKSIHILDKEADAAEIGDPVTIQLDREVDVSRGCVLTVDSDIKVTSSVAVTLLWMDDVKLEQGKNFFVKLGTKQIPATLKKIRHAIDVNTGELKQQTTLKKNEIAECELVFADAIAVDLFDKHRTMGELILIDRITNMTSACGVVTELLTDSGQSVSAGLDRERRSAIKGQRAITVEFQAESVSAEYVQKVEKELLVLGRHTYFYHPSADENYVDVVNHLNDAGIVVLFYADGVDTAAFAVNRSYVTGLIHSGDSEAETAKKIYERSSVYSEDSETGAFI